jgi:transcription initiation factor IIE alpha subunit
LSTSIGARALYVYALQENRMSYYDTVAQIKELLERNLDSNEIADRLCLNINQVNQIIATL